MQNENIPRFLGINIIVSTFLGCPTFTSKVFWIFTALEPDLLDLLTIEWLGGGGVLLIFSFVVSSFKSDGRFLRGWNL